MTRRARPGVLAIVPLSVALVLMTTSCTESGPAPRSTGDCSSQVRVDGIVYTSHGLSDRATTRHASAERAECHDSGENAPGSVFPDSPDRVTTWTFDGYEPTEVLGVRLDRESFAVYVADTVPAEDRDRIYEQLGRD